MFQGTTNRSPTLTETEMLRNLNKEFRGNGLSAELYSELVRDGAVMDMKNACGPPPRGVKVSTPRWAVGPATGAGVEMIDRIAHMGVHGLADPAPRRARFTGAALIAVQLLTAIPWERTEGVPTVTSGAR